MVYAMDEMTKRQKRGQLAWQRALDNLIDHSGRFRNRQRPQLVIKRGFAPVWSPLLWFMQRPSTWSAWNSVIVSAELLDNPPNRYLLAHELGHLYHRHHRRYHLASVVAVGVGSLLHLVGPSLPPWINAVGLAVFFASVATMVVLCSLRAEFEADRFAADLIGKEAVRRGIEEHARRTNGEVSHSALRRLSALH